MRGWKLRLSTILTATLALIAFAPPSMANHSLPATPEFWDCNVDHVADTTCVRFKRSGVPWTVDSATRIAAAATEWRSDTAFNIDENTTSGQTVYRDRMGCGITTWTPGDDVYFAVTCRTRTWDAIGEWWRITSAKTYFNNQMGDLGLSWYYGAGLPPNGNQVHFGGVAVHEFGHWIRLVDLPCTPGATMCGSADNAQEVFNLYSLSADDISAADSVY